MLVKGFTIVAFLIAGFTIWAAYTQRSALALRQESQPMYWSRHGTVVHGYYVGGSWNPGPGRSRSGFRGGGSSVGK